MNNFIKKLIMTSAILVVSAILITYFFVLYFKGYQEKHHIASYSVSFDGGFNNFEIKAKSAKSQLDKFTPTIDIDDESSEVVFPSINEIPNLAGGDEFAGMGYVVVPDSDNLADVIFFEDDNAINLKINSDIYSGFGGQYIMFSTAMQVSGASYFFYGKQADRAAVGYDYLIAVTTSPLGGFEGYGFSGFSILDGRGVPIDFLSEGDNMAGHKSGRVDGEFVKSGNSSYLLFARNSAEGFSDYYLCGFVNRSVISKHIAAVAIRIYIVLILICILFFVFLVLLMILNERDMAGQGTGDYRIEVDIQGNIMHTSKALNKRYIKPEGNISDHIAHTISGNNVVIKSETATGQTAYLSCKKTSDKNTKKVTFVVSDVTELFGQYSEIHRMHYTDDVTGMPNALQTEKDFDEMLASRGNADIGFIIYELGIEKYWSMYGLEFYKKLLSQLSQRFSEIYFASQAKIYYLGGDKLMVMFSKRILEIVDKIDSTIEFIGAPARVDDLIIRAVARAGYYIYSGGDEEQLNLSQIISRSEVALSFAKNSNKKSNYGYVDSVMRSKQSLSNEDICQIIDNNEINVFFQPQYSMSKKRIVSFESLTRLSGKYSYISPSTLIENVEQNGTMVLLGDHIAEKAMKFATTLEDKSIKVYINVSALQLLGDKFVQQFLARIAKHELAPSQIGVEITETYEISSISKAKENLKELKKHGVAVSIDDFGEKYSTLRYIKELCIDSIKIDKAFAEKIDSDHQSKAIVDVIIQLARNLNLGTVIEGVEKPEQVKVLQQLGADVIQGYIIGAAADEEAAREYLKTKRNLSLLEDMKK